jgi:hypothetical protein
MRFFKLTSHLSRRKVDSGRLASFGWQNRSRNLRKAYGPCRGLWSVTGKRGRVRALGTVAYWATNQAAGNTLRLMNAAFASAPVTIAVGLLAPSPEGSDISP